MALASVLRDGVVCFVLLSPYIKFSGASLMEPFPTLECRCFSKCDFLFKVSTAAFVAKLAASLPVLLGSKLRPASACGLRLKLPESMICSSSFLPLVHKYSRCRSRCSSRRPLNSVPEFISAYFVWLWTAEFLDRRLTIGFRLRVAALSEAAECPLYNNTGESNSSTDS